MSNGAKSPHADAFNSLFSELPSDGAREARVHSDGAGCRHWSEAIFVLSVS